MSKTRIKNLTENSECSQKARKTAVRRLNWRSCNSQKAVVRTSSGTFRHSVRQLPKNAETIGKQVSNVGTIQAPEELLNPRDLKANHEMYMPIHVPGHTLWLRFFFLMIAIPIPRLATLWVHISSSCPTWSRVHQSSADCTLFLLNVQCDCLHRCHPVVAFLFIRQSVFNWTTTQ